MIRFGIKSGFISVGLALTSLSLPAMAQDVAVTALADVQASTILQAPTALPQDYCISMMAEFPSDDMTPRYQFFRLTQELTQDATPGLRAALKRYEDKDIPGQTPILEIIENMANPVLRQAAPEIVVTYMGQLLQFSDACGTFVDGQVQSLKAYDINLTASDEIIREDALYLRQILSDSLFRVDADKDPYIGYAVTDYANALVKTRDNIEFASFTGDIDDLEALYMDDLDGRLARSNDIINKEIDRESLGDAVSLADDMNKAAKEKADQETLYTLYKILGGR